MFHEVRSFFHRNKNKDVRLSVCVACELSIPFEMKALKNIECKHDVL